MSFILRATNSAGITHYYTGRAGAAFVNPMRDEAFQYGSIVEARGKAANFNRMTAIHDWRFVAIREDGQPIDDGAAS